MSDPESYGYPLWGDTISHYGGFWLDVPAEPLDAQIDGLLKNADFSGLQLPGLGMANGRQIGTYLSTDRRTVVLRDTRDERVIPERGSSEPATVQTKTKVSVVADPAIVGQLIDLSDTYVHFLLNIGGEMPVKRISAASAALGFVGVVGYSFYEGIALRGNRPDTQALASLNIEYLVADATVAFLTGAAGWTTAKAISIGKKINADRQTLRASGKAEKQISSLINSHEAVTIPAVPSIVSGFHEAVMAMLMRDPNSKEFWDQYARPTISDVARYDLSMHMLRKDALRGVETKKDDEDEHVLRLKGQLAINSLINKYEERQRDVEDKNT